MGIESEEINVKIIYICDKCDTQFSNFEACMACERGHVMPVAYTGVEATGMMDFGIRKESSRNDGRRKSAIQE